MSADKPKNRLDQLKQKRADVVASGFKAADPEDEGRGGGGGGLIKALREGKPVAGGEGAAGGKRGLALRKLMEAGGRAGAGGDGQPMLQRLRDMQGGGGAGPGGRLGKKADTAEDHAARRARLDRYIADLEKSGGK